MVGFTGSILMGAIVYGKELYNFLKPRRVGIYGPTMVGKTTLDRFMTTPGEMEDIEERTDHDPRLIGGGHVLPKATRKRVRWHGEKRIVHSADVGGQQRFWNLWIEDAVTRRVEAIVYMFDERAFKGGESGLQQVGGFRFLVDRLITRDYRYRSLRARLKGKRYHPKLVMLVANKADRFFDDTASKLWHDGRIGEHKVFDPFRDDLIRLQKAGIPTKRSFMATRIGWNVEKTMLDVLIS